MKQCVVLDYKRHITGILLTKMRLQVVFMQVFLNISLISSCLRSSNFFLYIFSEQWKLILNPYHQNELTFSESLLVFFLYAFYIVYMYECIYTVHLILFDFESIPSILFFIIFISFSSCWFFHCTIPPRLPFKCDVNSNLLSIKYSPKDGFSISNCLLL